MAAIANVYAEHASSVTTKTGDTNWVNIVTLPKASFIANAKYFILVWGDFTSDDAANPDLETRVVHGTTPTLFTGTLNKREVSRTVTNDKQLYGPVVIGFTQPATTEDIILQMRTSDATATVEAGTCSAIAIRYDADLTEGDDYKFAEDDDTAATTELTSSYVTFASITFTPADNNHDWLVIYFVNILVDNAGSQLEVQLDHDSGTALAFFSREGEDFAEQLGYGSFWPLTLTNASHTIAVQAREANAASDHYYSSILALRLNAFENHTIATTTGTIDAFGDSVYGEIEAADITPDTAGDIVLLARAVTNEVGGSDESTMRIQIAGSDVIGLRGTDTSNGPWSARSFDTADTSPQFVMARENVAASLQNVDIDCKMYEGLSGQQNMAFRAAVVFSLELAGGAAAADDYPELERNMPRGVSRGILSGVAD